MVKSICIHGHFYQPPRENPWLEDVELQDSAYPYHDWNARVTAECYAPNSASRIINGEGKIIDIDNNYSGINFNFGPTLLSWLEKQRPEIYQNILEADAQSIQRFSGHGSAIAQVYNHMIMPLANTRDKRTQVVWGVRDFQKRFGRSPEGMWLPETAADTGSLELLAEQGIKFTILAPRQAHLVRDPSAGSGWTAVMEGNIDTRMPYLCVLPSGRTITLFFYDGAISQDIAFGNLLSNGENFARRLYSSFSDKPDSQLAHCATDGETYGHHHQYGDMALGYCIHYIEDKKLAHLTNYAEYLEKHPPRMEVKIHENSSWSCVHGVERWRDNCGCGTGLHPGWTQSWRKPLREAMDELRDILVPLYEREASAYLSDPWAARDAYIDVILDRSPSARERFFSAHAHKPLSHREQVTVLKLLEMQRNAMLMYTSCGWFFDEISGIETTQVMRYTSRALQLAEELSGASLEPIFLTYLEHAPSNVKDFKNGARVYELFAKPARIDFLRVAAHYAIFSLFDGYKENAAIYCYSARSCIYDKREYGKAKLLVGKVEITSEITLESASVSFAVLHLGDQNVNGGVSNFAGDREFDAMHRDIRSAFDRGDMLESIRCMEKHFGTNNYSLWHLFRDEQRKALRTIMRPTTAQIESSFRRIYENDYPIMNYFESLRIPVPQCLFLVTGYVVNVDLHRLFKSKDVDRHALSVLVDEVKRWALQIERVTLGYSASSWIDGCLERLRKQPHDCELMENVKGVILLLRSIGVPLDLWKSQNVYFFLNKKLRAEITKKSAQKDETFDKWFASFVALGEELNIRIERHEHTAVNV